MFYNAMKRGEIVQDGLVLGLKQIKGTENYVLFKKVLILN